MCRKTVVREEAIARQAPEAQAIIRLLLAGKHGSRSWSDG